MDGGKSDLKLLPTPGDRIAISANFPNLNPNKLFDFWIKPELLKRWWPPEVELEARLGGAYHFYWPSQRWHLRGKFTQFNRGERLGFTWKWDHEPFDETEVRLTFTSVPEGGSELSLSHGTYPDNDAGKKIRSEHIEGWMFFLEKLQGQE